VTDIKVICKRHNINEIKQPQSIIVISASKIKEVVFEGTHFVKSIKVVTK
jgi:hypothetical protein